LLFTAIKENSADGIMQKAHLITWAFYLSAVGV
jgi:hypothetical protein